MWSSMGTPFPHILVLMYAVVQSLKGWPLIAVLCWELTIGMAVWIQYGWGCKISSHKCGGSRANYGQPKQGQPDYCWSNIELLLQHIAIIVIASWGTADLLCVTYYVSIAEGMLCECCHGCCCSCFQRGTKRTAEGDEQNIIVDFSFPGKCIYPLLISLCTLSCGPGTYCISDLQSNSLDSQSQCMNYSHLKLWFPLELQNFFFTR